MTAAKRADPWVSLKAGVKVGKKADEKVAQKVEQ